MRTTLSRLRWNSRISKIVYECSLVIKEVGKWGQGRWFFSSRMDHYSLALESVKKMKQHQAKKVTKKGSKRYAPKKANVKKTAGRKPLAKKSGKKNMKVGK